VYNAARRLRMADDDDLHPEPTVKKVPAFFRVSNTIFFESWYFIQKLSNPKIIVSFIFCL
jgi:hypothetical protein